MTTIAPKTLHYSNVPWNEKVAPVKVLHYSNVPWNEKGPIFSLNVPDQNVVRRQSLIRDQQKELDKPTTPRNIDVKVDSIPTIVPTARKNNWRRIRPIPTWLKCCLAAFIVACIAAAVIVPVLFYIIEENTTSTTTTTSTTSTTSTTTTSTTTTTTTSTTTTTTTTTSTTTTTTTTTTTSTTTTTTTTTTTSTTTTTTTTTSTTTTTTSTTTTTTTTTTKTTTTTSTTTTSTTTTTTKTTTSTTTTTTTLTCNPSCVNGNCTWPGYCLCQPGWQGSACASANCTNPCQNNGICTSPNVCTCTSSWSGSTCTTPICNPSCLNGGTCTAPNTCQCITGVWSGNICQTPNRIFWAFDNNLQDLYNNFQGVGLNGPTYSSPGITGYGACLYLTRSSSQSVTIYSPPFLNMAYTSFTLEAWVKATTYVNMATGPYEDNAIFGQFQQNVLDQSLHIIVRNQHIYLGFFADDISGTATLLPGVWYHMAYVYDYSTLTQYVYVNGVLDVSGSPKGPYQGTTGDLTIGTNGVNYPNNYWDGCIDSVAYFALAKNATQVLFDATMSGMYTFDNTLLDSGPLLINATGSGYSYTSSGRVNQAILFSGSAYVQVSGFVLLGTIGQSYSMSIWIKPSVITSGSIVHVSSQSNGIGWCITALGFTSTGHIGAQSWLNSPWSSVYIVGPSVTANIWTHVATTYSQTNGFKLWINGAYYGNNGGGYNYGAASTPVYVTVGSCLSGSSCAPGGFSPYISMGQYNGYVDEFYIYSRELSSSDVYSLANP